MDALRVSLRRRKEIDDEEVNTRVQELNRFASERSDRVLAVLVPRRNDFNDRDNLPVGITNRDAVPPLRA